MIGILEFFIEGGVYINFVLIVNIVLMENGIRFWVF